VAYNTLLTSRSVAERTCLTADRIFDVLFRKRPLAATTKTDRLKLLSSRTEGDTRRLILAAAMSEFAEREYAKTTVESIAKRAKIGKGTVYLYFKNKADLFSAVVAEAMTDLLAVLRKRGSAIGDPIDRLRDCLNYQIKSALTYVPLVYPARTALKFFSKSYMDRIVSARQEILDYYAEIVSDAKLRGIIRDVDEAQVARIIGSMIHSVLFTKLALPSVVSNPEKHVESFLDILLNGILRK